MKPVRTETSNVTFVGEGCQELPGTRYLCDDGVTPGIETVWELDEKEKQQVLKSGRIYLYIMGRTVQPCFLATESAVRYEKDGEGDAKSNDDSGEKDRTVSQVDGQADQQRIQ